MNHLFHGRLALAVFFGLGCMQAHAQSAQPQSGEAPFSSVQDWSSRSVIHTKPMFPEELQRVGNVVEMQQLYSDPRYLTSVMRRVESELPRSIQVQSTLLPAAKRAATGSTDKTNCQNDRRWRRHCPATPDADEASAVTRDWSSVLGGGTDGQGGRGAAGIFPAKYTFDIFAPPSCSGDFVVYTTNAPGASQVGTAQEQWSGDFSGNPTAGQTVIIGLAGSRRVTLTTSTTVNTGTNFQIGGDNTSRATNLRDAVNRFSSQTGFRATGTGVTVTIVSNTVGNINDASVSEGLSGFSLTRSLPSGTAAPGQPTIIAFNQLYQGACNGTWNQNGAAKAPNVMWSYNTGTGFITETSPVLSYTDGGKQVAFVQRNANVLQLVLLKGHSGQGTAATPISTLTPSANAAAYRACLSNCYFVIPFSTTSGASNVGGGATYSSPFVDYQGDILWVGDGNGRLHKFADVFNGANPREITTGGFPKTVELGLKLSSPVFDYNNSVYVGNQSGSGANGGKIHRINATTGATAAVSSKLALANTTGVRESPIIDLRSQSVYAFVFNDDTSNYTDTAHCTAFNNEIDGCRAIIRLSTSFANNTNGVRQWIGRGNSVDRALYAGGFDDDFYNSEDGTGSMYITGGRRNNTFYATLWKVPLNAGALGSPVAGPEIGVRDRNIDGTAGTGNGGDVDNQQNLSPITVIKNPNTGFEYLYASTASWGNAAGCGAGTYASGCLYMYRLNETVAGTVNASETWLFEVGVGELSTGNIKISGTVLVAGVNFSTTGNRDQDRLALIAAINTVSGFSAATASTCSGNFCDLLITRTAPGNVSASTVTNNLVNLTEYGNSDGSSASATIQPVAWSPALTAGAALSVNPNTGSTVANQVVGGTGGIVVDNVRPLTDIGASQIYFTQGGSTGNAIQASQNALE